MIYIVSKYLSRELVATILRSSSAIGKSLGGTAVGPFRKSDAERERRETTREPCANQRLRGKDTAPLIVGDENRRRFSTEISPITSSL